MFHSLGIMLLVAVIAIVLSATVVTAMVAEAREVPAGNWDVVCAGFGGCGSPLVSMWPAAMAILVGAAVVAYGGSVVPRSDDGEVQDS